MHYFGDEPLLRCFDFQAASEVWQNITCQQPAQSCSTRSFGDEPSPLRFDFQAAFFHARDAGNGVAADKRVAVVVKNLVAADVIPLVAPHLGAADGAQGFAVVLHAGHAADLAEDDEKNERVARANKNAHDDADDADDGFKHNHAYK